MTRAALIDTYEKLQQQYATQYRLSSRRHYLLGLCRLLATVAALAGFYDYWKHNTLLSMVIAVVAVLSFFILMKVQQRVARKKILEQALLQVNEEEASFLRDGVMPFTDGVTYRDPGHAYSDDLDLFGKRSLYQYLNRSATQMGKGRLAQALQQQLPATAIPARQEAVAELSGGLENRQHLYALGKLAHDSQESHELLLRWAATKETTLHPLLRILTYVLPAILFCTLLGYGISKADIWLTLAKQILPLNLLLFSFLFKRIRTAMAGAEKVQETLNSYASLLRQIEETSYRSVHLQAMQQQLQAGNIKASLQLQKLSAICSGMESIQNPFAALGMNGLYLYHVHMLQRLIRWKQAYASYIPAWLDLIGELEMLNSLANFRYNNPAYCFPELNAERVISFESLGHPLIPAAKRVYNDTRFDQKRFMILTGSNMSGKSTFLRTLGINMVLAGMGSVVCAAAASVHPLPVFVSMRQSDSLADSESYFFAEVKRLQYIIGCLQQQTSFVLLDEILRGTNSDDKRSGTIGVIEKIIRTQAIGAIATHDLEVCLTTDAHPDLLVNKCFEVAIIDDELVFDYKLHDGICKNKSATFLMKKMDII